MATGLLGYAGAAAAGSLGVIEGFIGPRQQIIGCGPRLTQRDADREPDRHRLAAGIEGFASAGQQPLSHVMSGLAIGDVAQQHGELVTTDPSQLVAGAQATA